MNQKSIALILIIIIIIVLIIFIFHVTSLKKNSPDEGKVMVHGTYTITLGNKSNDDLGSFSNNMSSGDPCFYLNGIESPSIILKRGVYYEFINKTFEPFYFSEDSLGGEGAPRSIAKHLSQDFCGIADGILFLRVTDDLPDKFYYQSGKTKGMGGEVIIQG